MNDDSIKERILQATIELMRQDTANITVRKIAAQAGVTQGLINYHYQSKDRLTGLAAQRFVNETISRVSAAFDGEIHDPEQLLRSTMKRTLDYLLAHPNVSRVSVLKDLQAGQPDDNMQDTIRAFDKLLQGIIASAQKRFMAGHIFAAAIQSLFLRANVLRETNGFDIANEAARNQFVDDLIDLVLKGALA